jgi:hypothetical protein
LKLCSICDWPDCRKSGLADHGRIAGHAHGRRRWCGSDCGRSSGSCRSLSRARSIDASRPTTRCAIGDSR